MRRIVKKKRGTEGGGFYLAQYFCPPSLKARAGTRLLGPPAVHISFATVRSALKPPRKRESFEETTLHFIHGHLRRTPGGRSELLVSSLLESFFLFSSIVSACFPFFPSTSQFYLYFPFPEQLRIVRLSPEFFVCLVCFVFVRAVAVP